LTATAQKIEGSDRFDLMHWQASRHVTLRQESCSHRLATPRHTGGPRKIMV